MKPPEDVWSAAVELGASIIAPEAFAPDTAEISARGGWQDKARVRADLALTGFVEALASFGYRIVPEDPTQPMTQAAAKAMSPGKRPTEEWVSAREKHAYRYMAMLQAAPPFPPKEYRD